MHTTTSTSTPAVGSFSTEQITAQLRASAARFVTLIDRITDPTATSAHIPDWTAIEIVRHVTALPGYYVEIATGAADLISRPTDMGGKNLENMQRVDDLSPAECGVAIVDGIEAFCVFVEQAPDQVVDFQAGTRPRLVEVAAIAVGEYEIHGLDLAAAIGCPWRVGDDAAAMAVMGALPAAGAHWLDPSTATGHTGRYRVQLRGRRGQLHIAFDDGAATIHGSPDPRAVQSASTLINADPAAMLRVFYRRQSQWGAVAKGQIVSYGSRPIRALTLKDKFLPI